MIRFEALVMSETEPVQPGTLWIRKKRNSIKADGATKPGIAGFDIWYYGNKGWMPLFDLDTRYTFDIDMSLEEVTGNPLEWAPGVNDPEHGMVNKTLNYSIYDASRALSNAMNIVVEKGLKWHVDNLQSQINSLKNRVTVLENKVSDLEDQVDDHFVKITANTSSINNLNSRVQAVETEVLGYNSTIEDIEQSVQNLQITFSNPWAETIE